MQRATNYKEVKGKIKINGKYVDQGFLRAWLCQIARNESVTYLKNKSQKTADVSLDCSFVYDTYVTNPSCD